MKTKKSIVTFILILIPFLIAVGYSAWIIVQEFVVTPDFISNDVSAVYGVYQETTFNNEDQVPVPNDDSIFAGKNITYKSKLTTEKDFTTNLPHDHGLYDVLVTVEGVGTCQVKYYIKKKVIHFQKQVHELIYSSNYAYFASLKNNYLNSNVKFLDAKGNEVVDSKLGYNLTSITNGNRTYTASSTSTASYIVGSTYACYVELVGTNAGDNSNNYELEKNYFLLKLKSVYTNSTWYTIEDALLNQNALIYTMGGAIKNGSTTLQTFVATEFCSLTKEQGYPYSNYTTNTSNSKYNGKEEYNGKKIFEVNCKLLIPFDSNNDDFKEVETTYAANTTGSPVYSALCIPESVALVFNSSTQLQIGGIIGINGNIGTHGVIMNNGLITMESSSRLFSYGFLKGIGDVICRSGSICYDIMKMFDWPGGTDATKMVSKAFPIAAWSLHNISCNLKIYKGAAFKGYSSLTATGVGYQKPEFGIIGIDSNASGCLFKPSVTATDEDYIFKKATSNDGKINTEISANNQVKGQRDVIELYGDYEDSSLSLTITVHIITDIPYTFSTSKSISVPISYMDIVLKSGTCLNISVSSYTFLTGTSLTVEEGSTLKLGDGIYVAFDKAKTVDGINTDPTSGYAEIASFFTYEYGIDDDDAYLMLKGDIEGSGSIGGTIKTEVDGAILTLDNYLISSITFKQVKYSSVVDETTGAIKQWKLSDSTTHSLSNYQLYGETDTSNDNLESLYDSSISEPYSYVTSSNSGGYFFIKATGVKTFILNFYNDKNKTKLLGSKKIQVLERFVFDEENSQENDPMKQYDGKYIYQLTGNEFTATVDHYIFNCWKFVSNDGVINNMIIVFDENDLPGSKEDDYLNTYDIYGDFSMKTYNIEYFFGLKSSDGTITNLGENEVSFANKVTSFNISNFTNVSNSLVFNISTTPSYNNLDATFWYLYNPFTQEIVINNSSTKITEEQLLTYIELFSENDEITIYLYCEFMNYEKYTFILQNDSENEFADFEEIIDGTSITLPQTSKLTDTSYALYIEGWYLDENYTILYSNPGSTESFNEEKLKNYVIDENNNIKLFAKWITKDNAIHYYVTEEAANSKDIDKAFKSQYYNDDQQVTFLDGKDSSSNTITIDDEEVEDSNGLLYYNKKVFADKWNIIYGDDVYDVNSSASNNGTVYVYAVFETLISFYYIERTDSIDTTEGKNGSAVVAITGQGLSGTEIINYNKQNLGDGERISLVCDTKVTITITFNIDSWENHGNYSYTISGGGIDEVTESGITASAVSTKTPTLSGNPTSAVSISITYAKGSNCIPSGTIMTLADGSKKKIEDLTLNDMLLVFNHETGKFESAPIVFIDIDEWKTYDIVNLVFSNGNITRLIYEHGYFDLTLNKYVYITESNYQEYIGHEFVVVENNEISSVRLIDSYITQEYSGCYSPVTAYHLNYIVDGMLSMPGGIEGIFNIFEYGDGLKYDEDLMSKDIEEYGLMSYDELSNYVPYDIYCAFPAKYFNVAIGKNMITFDEIIAYIEKYLGRHDLIN